MQENFAERQIAAASNHDPGNGIYEIRALTIATSFTED